MGPAFLFSTQVCRKHQLSEDRALASLGLVEVTDLPGGHQCQVVPEAAGGPRSMEGSGRGYRG